MYYIYYNIIINKKRKKEGRKNMKKILFVNRDTKAYAFLTTEQALDIMMTESRIYEVSDNIAYLDKDRVIEYYNDMREFNSRMKGLQGLNYSDITELFND